MSQFRRVAMSVILNYIEGYARRRKAVQLNFYEISYGSLQESSYLLEFALEEGWINGDQHRFGVPLVNEIGAMLWSEISSVEKSIDS